MVVTPLPCLDWVTLPRASMAKMLLVGGFGLLVAVAYIHDFVGVAVAVVVGLQATGAVVLLVAAGIKGLEYAAKVVEGLALAVVAQAG